MTMEDPSQLPPKPGPETASAGATAGSIFGMPSNVSYQ